MNEGLALVVVTAAVVERDGRFLVASRIADSHLEGCWEFPGGKCERDEEPVACLEREIREELNARVQVGREILRTSHAYPDRTVQLRFFECDLIDEPTPMLGQQMRWVSPVELAALEFPPADQELIELLTETRHD